VVYPAHSARTVLVALATALAAALAAGAGAACAQERAAAPTIRVIGRIRDATSGEAVPHARVWLMVGGAEQARIVWSGLSDDNGAWTSAPLAAGPMDLQVEAFGYRNATGPVDAPQGTETRVLVDLVPEPLEMEPLVVVSNRRSRLDTSGFNQRRRQGQGFSITREEFESRHPARASDVFRLLPGVSVQPGRRGNSGVLRYRGCSPDLVLDGVPLLDATAPDDILSVMDIEAVEVQSGVLFPSRGMGSSCGTVMIWTREGNREELGHPMTWRRAGAVAGFILLAILLTR
jgi:hypothetical protein